MTDHIPGDTIYYLQPIMILPNGTHLPNVPENTFFKCTIIEVTWKQERPYNAVKYKLQEQSTGYTFISQINDTYTKEQHRQFLIDKILTNE